MLLLHYLVQRFQPVTTFESNGGLGAGVEKQSYRTINAIIVNLCKHEHTLKRSICLLQIPVQCCAVEMENMRKVTVCVEMGGKDLNAMFQKSSVLIQPALAMVLVSWASASVSLDTKETSARKVCEDSLSVVRGVDI